MARLTRRQQQERTRRAVLGAAADEFSAYGYVDAKVDRIADRAELTRGAVYSNFPSKRALYLAVLADQVTQPNAGDLASTPPTSLAKALGAFARAWLERLPLTGDTAADSHLQLRSLVRVIDDEPDRVALAQVMQVEALLFALALERTVAGGGRRVRLAELVLTLLNGSTSLAETAAGFSDPFDVVHGCEHLAGIDLADGWNPPYLPYVPPATPTDQAWTPPTGMPDQLSGRAVDLTADGVIAVLGSHRLSAAEEAVRASRRRDQVTVVAVTSDPAEIGRLVQLRIADLAACLRRVFPVDTWSRLRLILDDHAVIAAALGLPEIGDDTEAAVRIQNGAIVARAHGRGAAHAAASVTGAHPTSLGEPS